jgi:hypothetical protein
MEVKRESRIMAVPIFSLGTRGGGGVQNHNTFDLDLKKDTRYPLEEIAWVPRPIWTGTGNL